MSKKKKSNLSDEHNPFKARTLSSLLIKFSAPAVAGMFVSALFNIISRVYIGNEFGAPGIASLTLLFPMGFFFMAFCILIGVGANALFSIRLGEKKEDEARQIIGNALVMLTIISLTIMILMYIFRVPMLHFLGADEITMPYVLPYLIVVLPGYALFNIGAGMNNFIRSAGHPKTAMATQFIGAFLNLTIAPITIFVLHWGMPGAGIATVVGQTVSFAWVMLFFFSPKNKFHLHWRFMKLRADIIFDSMKIGVSQAIFQLASSAMNYLLNHALLRYGGNLAVSAMGIAISANMIFIMPLLGLSQGAQPLIGYNYGARKYAAAFHTLRMALRWGFMFGLGGMIVTLGFAPQIAKIFNSNDPQLISTAAYAMRIMNILMAFDALQILGTSFFQAINKPVRAAVLSLSRQILFLIPAVLILPQFFELNGVFFAPPVADLLSCLLTYFMLRGYFAKYKQNFFLGKKFN
ncbi:MAG: MATE family efflux transporter [Elusimicrobiaceae bacterium]|nr:MATE family efflux transporter [Elusimicrobiaceae bacterium]